MPRYIELIKNANKSELSKELGVSRQMLYDLVHKKYTPNILFLTKLSKIMKCDVEDVL
jgi:DNA-binding XRE family transcriptional regulator